MKCLIRLDVARVLRQRVISDVTKHFSKRIATTISATPGVLITFTAPLLSHTLYFNTSNRLPRFQTLLPSGAGQGLGGYRQSGHLSSTVQSDEFRGDHGFMEAGEARERASGVDEGGNGLREERHTSLSGLMRNKCLAHMRVSYV